MEASGSVLVDKSLYPKRNSSFVPGFHGSGSNNSFLLGSASQRLLNIHGARAGTGSLGPHPLPYGPYLVPAPTYYSLPTPSPHPPLLPLPVSKCLSLPSPSPPASSTRMVGAAAVHSVNKDQKKPRSSPAVPKKDLQRGATRPQKVPPAAAPPARVPKAPATATSPCKDEKPEDVGDFSDDVFALSPPPSSLPMPKFSLRVRTPLAPSSASCNAEAFGGRGALMAGADAGASDDLRRLLRLY